MSYPNLNFPKFELKISDNKIWDIVRKKMVLLTPEEWVRQHTIHYLIHHLNYPLGLVAVEQTVNYNGMNKRADIVCYSNNMKPILIVECKAADISLKNETLFQIAKYTASLKASYLVLTNGVLHYSAKIDKSKNELIFLDTIPLYHDIIKD